MDTFSNTVPDELAISAVVIICRMVLSLRGVLRGKAGEAIASLVLVEAPAQPRILTPRLGVLKRVVQ